MEEKKIKKKKLTLSVSSNKIHNVPHYAQDRKKTSVVVGKKTSQNLISTFHGKGYILED